LPTKTVSTAVFILWDGRLPLFCPHHWPIEGGNHVA
jgi:hypothetical protein